MELSPAPEPLLLREVCPGIMATPTPGSELARALRTQHEVLLKSMSGPEAGRRSRLQLGSVTPSWERPASAKMSPAGRVGGPPWTERDLVRERAHGSHALEKDSTSRPG